MLSDDAFSSLSNPSRPPKRLESPIQADLLPRLPNDVYCSAISPKAHRSPSGDISGHATYRPMGHAANHATPGGLIPNLLKFSSREFRPRSLQAWAVPGDAPVTASASSSSADSPAIISAGSSEGSTRATPSGTRPSSPSSPPTARLFSSSKFHPLSQGQPPYYESRTFVKRAARTDGPCRVVLVERKCAGLLATCLRAFRRLQRFRPSAQTAS